MPAPSTTHWPRPIVTTAGLLSFTLVVAILYWGRVVLVPLALAILITFLLSPLVTRVQRWGLPRIPAALLVTLTAGLILFAVFGFIATELAHLGADLPKYRENITSKVASIREATRGGVLRQLRTIVDEIAQELEPQVESAEAGAPRQATPVPVEIYRSDQQIMGFAVFQALLPALAPLAMAGFVIVLVIFMLISREDLRNRVVGLAGQGRLAVTTKALDDAGHRISRYLLMQFVINASFGIAVGTGLLLIGIPYALLWGLTAGVLRYIPYVGPWVAAVLPLGTSLLILPGWGQALGVVALFIVLELISNNLLEPLLYGQSVGVSPVALLISAVFWAWLWGPLGLILTTPLTVCLVVGGKYIPFFSLFDRLMGDTPVLEPHTAFYQRLLAHDDDEAFEIVEEVYKTESPEKAFDQVIIPALVMAKRDRAREHISREDQKLLLEAIEEMVENLGWSYPPEVTAAPATPPRFTPVVVIGCPARDKEDELALQLFARLLEPQLCEFRIIPSTLLTSERVAAIEQENPAIVYIASLPPGDVAHTRYLGKRLGTRLPHLKIHVGRWGSHQSLERNREVLRASGAHEISLQLSDSVAQLTRELSLLGQRDLAPPPDLEPTDASPEIQIPKTLEAAQDSLLATLRKLDDTEATAFLHQAIRNFGLESVATRLLPKTLDQLQNLHKRNLASSDELRFAAELVRSRLLTVIKDLTANRRSGPRVVIFAPDEQDHPTSVVLAAALAARGWNVTYLERHVPEAQVAEIVESVHPNLLLLVAQTSAGATQLTELVKLLPGAGIALPVALAGAGFSDAVGRPLPATLLLGDERQIVQEIEQLAASADNPASLLN